MNTRCKVVDMDMATNKLSRYILNIINNIIIIQINIRTTIITIISIIITIPIIATTAITTIIIIVTITVNAITILTILNNNILITNLLQDLHNQIQAWAQIIINHIIANRIIKIILISITILIIMAMRIVTTINKIYPTIVNFQTTTNLNTNMLTHLTIDIQ